MAWRDRGDTVATVGVRGSEEMVGTGVKGTALSSSSSAGKTHSSSLSAKAIAAKLSLDLDLEQQEISLRLQQQREEAAQRLAEVTLSRGKGRDMGEEKQGEQYRYDSGSDNDSNSGGKREREDKHSLPIRQNYVTSEMSSKIIGDTKSRIAETKGPVRDEKPTGGAKGQEDRVQIAVVESILGVGLVMPEGDTGSSYGCGYTVEEEEDSD